MSMIIHEAKLLQLITSRFASTWWMRCRPLHWTTVSTMAYTTVDWQLH